MMRACILINQSIITYLLYKTLRFYRIFSIFISAWQWKFTLFPVKESNRSIFRFGVIIRSHCIAARLHNMRDSEISTIDNYFPTTRPLYGMPIKSQ